jgi:hypothetical protein
VFIVMAEALHHVRRTFDRKAIILRIPRHIPIGVHSRRDRLFPTLRAILGMAYSLHLPFLQR